MTDHFVRTRSTCESDRMVTSLKGDPSNPFDPRHIDPDRFDVHIAEVNRQRIAYVRENAGGGPALLLLHGWPETKRVWWKVRQTVPAEFSRTG